MLSQPEKIESNISQNQNIPFEKEIISSKSIEEEKNVIKHNEKMKDSNQNIKEEIFISSLTSI